VTSSDKNPAPYPIPTRRLQRARHSGIKQVALLLIPYISFREQSALRESQLAVLALKPACPDAQDQSSVTDAVHRFRHRRQQVGIAIAVAGDQATDLDMADQRRHGRQQRPGFKSEPAQP